jgi:hypothetical protein
MSLDNYETVAERIEKWWSRYLEIGRIETELIFSDGNRYVIKASGYRDMTDLVPFATGYCEEIRSNANRHPLENAETGAIGRMLHNAGISKFSDGIPRPSREEMKSVENRLTVVPEIIENEIDPWVVHPLEQNSSSNAPMTCKHGEMSWKEGTNAKGPYSGWVCKQTDRAQQCKAVWL